MDVYDWDLRAVHLDGLDLSFTPSHTASALRMERADPYSDTKVQRELRTTAIFLYNHQNLIPMFQEKVTNGKNTLAYFVCALFEPSTSSPTGKGGRPKLRNSVALPLGHWDRLYYVITAEIRRMYIDLQHVYGANFGNGGVILHNAGSSGTTGFSRQPLSAVRMAEMLEGLWRLMTDHRLVGPLDYAVRVRNAENGVGGADVLSQIPDQEKLIEVAEGLADVNSMTPDNILQMVWFKQAEEARRTSGRSIEEQSLLAACRAEILEAGIIGRRSSEQKNTDCICNDDCHCRGRCSANATTCECRSTHDEVREIVNGRKEGRDTFNKRPETPSQHSSKHLFGAIANKDFETKIAAQSNSDPWIVHACHATSEAAEKLDKDILAMRRAHFTTEGNNLADCPTSRTPSRANKDAYPLDFYGDSPKQRIQGNRSGTPQDIPPPLFAPSSGARSVPRRKPVPLPLTVNPPTTSINAGHSRSRDGWQTPESSPSGPDLQPSQISYPTIPQSQSQSNFTNSFPVSARGNPRDADTDRTLTAADYTQLTGEVHNTIRPFSEDGAMNPQRYAPLRPNFHTTATSPDAIEARPTYGEDATNTTPPLAEPDFIAPRPATKQRYVSAGGNAKLQDRQEIEGPAFAHNLTGASMNKAELLEKLNDPDFIRNNFGEAAAQVSLSMDRDSQETDRSQRVSGQSSLRNSRDDLIKHEKRERTQSGGSVGSGGSARFGKLKRVFSRKNSECE